MADTHGEGLRSAAATLTAAELTDACEAFHQHFRQRSARRVLYVTQFLWAAAIAGALVWCGARSPMTVLDSVHWAALSLFAVAIVWRLFAAAALTPTLSRLAAPERWPIYTILCPLYREAAVTPDLVAALQRLDYPPDRLDIKLLVEGDDVETLAAALAASDNASIEVVIVPAAAPRTKPKALNAGLARARGDYVVVYDAEDRPHPQQLRAALAAFEDGDPRLACVQAPLEIDNTDASWIAQQFATEYAIQFHEVLPLLARLELPLPLGGSSNHFRIEALHAEGGWDPYNVSEDRAIFANKLNCFRARAFHIPFASHSCASAA